ncbi:flagellar export chaperone FliS [Anoxybacter fermentans]|uniref:Flagellar secretion chaperone FliS n=1 Tax=Anoxybacter fermentans TaxID=1323375 RepID=A0A3Q9HR72_9FIRM|nr:flagellar export chaperone FliS [Anoxybacter fermentans]AZR73891.1 flagellar export chaperone FliS [Anoxybacter fermentans]
MLNNPYQAYQKTQIETASQGKLILMLFDGAIKFCKTALQGLEEKDYEKVNTNITKAQAIINELMITLDRESGGEIAQNLYLLYDYMFRRLITANIKKSSEMINEVLNMLVDFRQTWEEVIKLARKENYRTD